jgi:hypothetical protein
MFLLSLLFAVPVLGAQAEITQGHGYTICEAALAALRKDLPAGDSCSRRIEHDIPGLSEAPWRTLDIEAHWQLFVKFNRYDLKAGGGTAFDALMTRWRADAKVGTIKMQVAQAHLLGADGEQQTLVRVLRKNGCESGVDDSSMHIVRPDLSGLDTSAEKQVYWIPRGDLDMFGGRAYIVYWNLGHNLLIASPAIQPGIVPFCAIDY